VWACSHGKGKVEISIPITRLQGNEFGVSPMDKLRKKIIVFRLRKTIRYAKGDRKRRPGVEAQHRDKGKGDGGSNKGERI